MDTSLKGRTLANLVRTIVEADAPCTTKEHHLYLTGYIDALLWVRKIITRHDNLVKAVCTWIESRNPRKISECSIDARARLWHKTFIGPGKKWNHESVVAFARQIASDR